MKKFLPLMSLLIIILLAACSGGSAPQVDVTTPTISSDDLQTQIAQMLTQLPTDGANVETAPTPELPTVAPEEPAAEEPVLPAAGVLTATPVPTETQPPQPEQPTATVEPPQPTATVEAAAVATATQPAGPTATLAAGDPRSRLGAPSSTDSMDSEFGWIWPTGSDKFTRGSFGSGVQTITALGEKDGWRMANPLGRDFSNIYLEGTIKTNTCAGSDHYGLIVRVPAVSEPDQGYLFGVTCDGRYSLRRWNAETGPRGEMKVLVNWTTSSAIKTGSNQVNRLGIFTVGSRLVLYINGERVSDVNDTMFPSGYFGVFLGSSVTPGFSIQVDEMSYWENVTP
jgi:hypothetical protein